jgi:hypothetical protein
VQGLGSEAAMSAWYIQDTRSMVGNSMSWWAIDGKGYTCDIQRAGVYTKEEAFAQHKMRSTDRPWPKKYIDARLSHHVDFQHVDYSQVSGEVKP